MAFASSRDDMVEVVELSFLTLISLSSGSTYSLVSMLYCLNKATEPGSAALRDIMQRVSSHSFATVEFFGHTPIFINNVTEIAGAKSTGKGKIKRDIPV